MQYQKKFERLYLQKYPELQPRNWHAFIILTKVILGIFWAILETDTWEPLVELTPNDPFPIAVPKTSPALYIQVRIYTSEWTGACIVEKTTIPSYETATKGLRTCILDREFDVLPLSYCSRYRKINNDNVTYL